MSSRTDWVPRPDEEFEVFFKKYVVTVKTNTSGATPLWTHIPNERVNELTNSYGAWHIAYDKLSGAHTPGDVIAKNEARDAGEDLLRAFNREYILNAREVTNAQREDIGCPVHDTTHTPVPRPKAEPEADIVYPGKHLLELARIRAIAGTLSDEEEKAEFGVRIFWGILGEPTAADKFRISAPPEKGDDLPHSTFTHRKRFRFDFEGDSGKTVYFCLRYENQKGGNEGEGPFGPIMSAIIP
ncbi:MAG: hypothetical protein LBK63_02685 [Treponema sp.]|jgi:hypothetical protein|nr:hypothetical protein [Treponema sp.]